MTERGKVPLSSFMTYRPNKGIRCSVIEVVVRVDVMLAEHERKAEHRIKIKFDAEIDTSAK